MADISVNKETDSGYYELSQLFDSSLNPERVTITYSELVSKLGAISRECLNETLAKEQGMPQSVYLTLWPLGNRNRHLNFVVTITTEEWNLVFS